MMMLTRMIWQKMGERTESLLQLCHMYQMEPELSFALGILECLESLREQQRQVPSTLDEVNGMLGMEDYLNGLAVLKAEYFHLNCLHWWNQQSIL